MDKPYRIMANRLTPNRAERVRARRERKLRTRVKHRTRRRRNALSFRQQQSPPFTVRGGRARVPIRRRHYPKARRQYNLVLGAQGAEVRLPAVPELRLGWRTLSGLLVAGLLAILFHLLTSPTYQVSAAQVLGAQRLSGREVNLVLNLSATSVFSLDPARMRRDLEEAFPELAEVNVRVRLPNRVVVEVKEREPVLVWQRENGSLWVDAEGVVFLPRGEVSGLPVVVAEQAAFALPREKQAQENALRIDAVVPQELVSAVLQLASMAPRGVLLLYDAQHGLGWEDPGGWQVYFGNDGTQMRARLLVYQALVQHLQEKGVRPTLISVEHLHAPYYRVEK